MNCRHSGRDVLWCKVSDLCDCFDYPEADPQALAIIAKRDALAERTQTKDPS